MEKLPRHLGGHLWKTHVDDGILKLFKEIEIKTMLDVGCGPGGMVISSRALGIESWGVDGDFTLKRENPSWFFTHDYTKGPFISNISSVDVIWCCEFVEHVHKQFEDNYMQTMSLAKYIFMTYSDPGKPGHHHVNCEPVDYWVNLYEKNHFKLNEEMTKTARAASTMKRDFFRTHGLVFEKSN